MEGGVDDNPSKTQIKLTPVIKEMVRTQVCFPNIKLLVNKIAIILLKDIEHQSKNEAFRLLLTDGEKSIQALVKRRSYKLLIGGDVCEGSYILVKKFQLARARKVAGDGLIVYLVLEDFYAIGDDQRPTSAHESFAIRMAARVKEPYARKTESTRPIPDDDPPIENLPSIDESGLSAGKREKLQDSEIRSELPVILEAFNDGPTQRHVSPETSSQRKRKRQIALGEIDANLDSGSSQHRKRGRGRPRGSATMSSKSSSATPFRPLSTIDPKPTRFIHQSASTGPERAPHAVAPHARPQSAGNLAAPPAPPGRGRLLQIDRPLNIKPLAAFRGYPTRYDVYDVFVVIFSISDVMKPSKMPPKRDVRLVDRSTEKKVLLSVFCDPESFTPAVGTVALIRNVNTHEWAGGTLNIYANQCEGREWFMPDPTGVEGCDVDDMRRWWARVQDKERK